MCVCVCVYWCKGVSVCVCYQVEEVDSPTLRSPSSAWPCARRCTAPSSAAPAAAAPPCRCWCGAGRRGRSPPTAARAPPGPRRSSWSDSPARQQPANTSVPYFTDWSLSTKLHDFTPQQSHKTDQSRGFVSYKKQMLSLSVERFRLQFNIWRGWRWDKDIWRGSK